MELETPDYAIRRMDAYCGMGRVRLRMDTDSSSRSKQRHDFRANRVYVRVDMSRSVVAYELSIGCLARHCIYGNADIFHNTGNRIGLEPGRRDHSFFDDGWFFDRRNGPRRLDRVARD